MLKTLKIWHLQLPLTSMRILFTIWLEKCALRRILNKYEIDFASNYFDNITVFSQDKDKHFWQLKILLEIYVQENLKLELSKYNFVKSTIIYFIS